MQARDSEDGEDDEMPCVIGESARDCLTRLAEISGEFIPWRGYVPHSRTPMVSQRANVDGTVGPPSQN